MSLIQSRQRYSRFAFAFVIAAILDFSQPLGADTPIDFGQDILPILSENCYHCHGPDEAERAADLRLDTSEGATQDLGGYAAVVAQEPDESELILRVESDDLDARMPPMDSGFSLDDQQRKLLRNWIEQGGHYTEHWAFVPPKKSAAKRIDELVDSRLGKESMTRSEPAVSEVLCRRLFLDLIGLPPSPTQIDEFVRQDKVDRENAVNQLITQLLSSDAYPEKWARHWLDVARYADTNGFEKDMPREQWAWRDWVIRSIANDQPYDQFVIEQVAGDLIPNATQDQQTATGFLRNGMVNEEGAIVAEQFRVEGIVDRMDCLGKAVLGLSLQCAQCHSHKFDPLSHEEYYGIFAFLNDTHEAKSWVYSAEQLETLHSIDQQIAEIDAAIKRAIPDWEEKVRHWAEGEREQTIQWQPLTAIELEWIGGVNHPVELPDRSIVVLGHPTGKGQEFMIAQPETRTLTAIRIEALRYGDLPFGGPGRSHRGVFALSEVELWSRDSSEEEWKPVKWGEATVDFAEAEQLLEPFFRDSRSGKTEEKRLIGPASFLVDNDRKTAWRADRGPILRHAESVALIRLAEPLQLSKEGQIKIQLSQDHGGFVGINNQQLGRFRIGVTDAEDPVLPSHDHSTTLALEPDSEIADPNQTLFRAWRKTVPELAEPNQRIAKLESTYPEAPTSVLTLTATGGKFARQTHLLDRGAWDQPQQATQPHTPAALPPMETESPTRLDFARWLVDEKHPLPARVQVNRVWQAMFGSGLVETAEDFGARTPRPEHVDVLDWLAVDFMENQWSLKHLVRQIAQSETYQQSSRLTPERLERDPKNRLLARGARFRAEAEVVRDIALVASGLLHHEVGGPSFYPPVPQSLLDYNFTKPEWNTAEPPQRYRRSLYLFRKRSMPDPVLSSFDAPNSDFACARRIRSNSPLAALVSLNEAVFIEASQAMALRVLTEGGESEEQRIDFAYRLTTGRTAREIETREVLRLLESNRQRLAEGWLSIQSIAFRDPGNRPELPKGVTPQDVAAWAMACRVLLNLDETLTRN